MTQDEIKRLLAATEVKAPKAQKAAPAIDPRAWLSEIGGTVGAIGGGLVGGPAGAAAGAAGGTALGKVLEQKVKGEDIKPRELFTETALSGLFAAGPIKAAKGIGRVLVGKGISKGAQKGTQKGLQTAAKRGAADTAYRMSLGVDDVVSPSRVGPKTIITADKVVDEAAKAGIKGSPNTMRRQVLAQYNRLSQQYFAKLAESTKTLPIKTVKANIASSIADDLPVQKIYKTELTNTLKRLDKYAKNGELNAEALAKFKSDLRVGRAFEKAQGILQSDFTAKEFVDLNVWNTIDKLIGGNRTLGITGLAPQAKKLSLRMSRYYPLIQGISRQAKMASPDSVSGMVTMATKPALISAASRVAQPFVAKEAGKKVAKETAKETAERAGRQRLPATTSLLRQVVATGTRGALAPLPAVPEEELGMEEDITGIGAEPTLPPIDPRLPRIITAIEQDIARTGGKNIKNIQTLAGLYGVDLTPIGLQPAGAKKTTVDAATKRQLAGIRTGAGIVDELENLITRAGGGAGRVGGAVQGLVATVGLAPEVRTFQAARNAYISRLSRALGEVGVLTDQDIDRARQAVPNINDSPREVQLKLASLRRIISDAYNQLQAEFER